jgi:2-polyprenyl-3-methyl-5-hydroxy-6-metoxy-1,4-benzoquinol methylase
MLAAELVGPTGSFVGIDRRPEVIVVARERALTAGLGHVNFEAASVDAFSDPEPFDAAIGRCILIHQADPVALFRAAGRRVCPGGVVACHELSMCGQVIQSLPSVSLWQQAGDNQLPLRTIRTEARCARPRCPQGRRPSSAFAIQ